MIIDRKGVNTMKELRLVFNNIDGKKCDITLPMEKWIRDWCYECNYVPDNDVVPEIAELDGKDILKYFPDNYNTFEDIAYTFRWNEIHNNFYGDVNTGVVENTAEVYERWIKENITEERVYFNIR